MGAHRTDHENNKIKQEHCKDLISPGLDQYCKLMDEKHTSTQDFAMVIRKKIFHLIIPVSVSFCVISFFAVTTRITAFHKFVFRLVIKVTLGERLTELFTIKLLSVMAPTLTLGSILNHDQQRNKHNL